jgi:hypothetical protein
MFIIFILFILICDNNLIKLILFNIIKQLFYIYLSLLKIIKDY